MLSPPHPARAKENGLSLDEHPRASFTNQGWSCAGGPQSCLEDVDKPIGDTNNQRQNLKTTGRGRCSGSLGKARLLLVGEMRESSLEKVAFEPGLEGREDYFPFHKGSI